MPARFFIHWKYVTLCSPNHRDNALAACCRLMMAGAGATVVPPAALLQALLPVMPFQGDLSENETALAAICWLFAQASDASISGCLLQCAQQIVVAVARTMQFYQSQSDVQLSAQTQAQISSSMKAWSASFGVEGMMQVLVVMMMVMLIVVMMMCVFVCGLMPFCSV